MFLSRLFIENFRTFGSEADGRHLQMDLRPGLNLLAGENDSGKTAVIDAIRHVLWTTSLDYHRLTEDDFHVAQHGRATALRISCSFTGLSQESAARFLEWLSVDERGSPLLIVTLRAVRVEIDPTSRVRSRRVAVTVRSGKDGDGPSIEGEIREFLRVTYLRPLRDAEAELAAGQGSRLSQILQSHPGFQNESRDDFDPEDPQSDPQTLVGIMRHAEHRIAANKMIIAAQGQLNEDYLQHVSVGDDTLTGSIGVARSAELRQILEKLELRLDPSRDLGIRTPRGLGFNNVLFMATELLLLGETSAGALPMLLIEEPEAHLHPQLQLRLMDFLDRKCASNDTPVQVLVTTHSPNLASKVDLQSLTLMHRGEAFSLASACTLLSASDYGFLRRFLDVTKANLFFAKAVLIVEGDAENILLPVIADLLDRSFSKNGVSIVNVGSRGLFRYSRIFQRRDGQSLPIRVACLADRDIPPANARGYVPKRRNRKGEAIPTYDTDFTDEQIDAAIDALKSEEAGCVRIFVSPAWTLEHDLAMGGLAEYVHVAIQIARRLRNKPNGLSPVELRRAIREAKSEVGDWRGQGISAADLAANVYEDLFLKRASKAETAQVLAEILQRRPLRQHTLRQALPDYIVNAIDYVTRADGSGEVTNATTS